jgi:hypothetical protein
VTRARGASRWRLSLPPLPGAAPLGGWIYLHRRTEVAMPPVPASVLLTRLAARRTWPALPSDRETLLALAAHPGWDLGRPADRRAVRPAPAARPGHMRAPGRGLRRSHHEAADPALPRRPDPGHQPGTWLLRNSADSPPRHETLRTAIGWSHQLCTAAERLLWARLSVFPGSFRLPDAQDVCAGRHLPGQAVDAAVATLAAPSILLMDLRAGRQARFRLPGTVRAYGAGMLHQLSEDAEWQRRYQAWQEAHPSSHE